jgi:hypothetical protein
VGDACHDRYWERHYGRPKVLIPLVKIMSKAECELTHEQSKTERQGEPIRREEVGLCWLQERSRRSWFDKAINENNQHNYSWVRSDSDRAQE